MLIERFKLDERAQARMAEFSVDTPWQAFIQVRLKYYDELLADPETLRQNQWEHNVALLKLARQKSCRTGLATMSHCEQVRYVLDVLDLADHFDFVATRDDVQNGKPDPEIYLLVASELGITSDECLVIEDSAAGVRAAQAAGMHVIAVATPFTHQSLHSAELLDDHYIVDEPEHLLDVVREFIDSF